jgi:hypothetical protein
MHDNGNKNEISMIKINDNLYVNAYIYIYFKRAVPKNICKCMHLYIFSNVFGSKEPKILYTSYIKASLKYL